MSDDRRGNWNDQYIPSEDFELIEAEEDLDTLTIVALVDEDEEEGELEYFLSWDEWDDDAGESLESGLDED